MTEYKIYIEAHKTIAKIIDSIDMSDLAEITGDQSMKQPSEEVQEAMYAIARNHQHEAQRLEGEEVYLKGVHGNLVAPEED